MTTREAPTEEQCYEWAIEARLVDIESGLDPEADPQPIQDFADLAHAAGYAAGLEAAATICEETKRQYGHRLANAIRGAKAAP